ncbi:MAG: tRNA pseudouridine(55) synthase TruB [Minisyncoccia bacterium]|jgi:tRNA pseudouridine55 synthase
MEGIILFNKPSGYTSYQIVEFFKRKTNKKVGHGGTLDPLAEGLLIIGVGEYTKELTKFLKNSIKEYICTIKLGYISNTYDKEGEIIKTNKEIPSFEKTKEILESFKGKILQRPPIYSAIKIKGIPLYKLAREGKKIDVKEREVEVYDLEVLSFQNDLLTLRIKVSSGFYVRSFANELGEKLGCGAYLEKLIRTKINNFDLEFALTFEDFEKDFLEFQAKIYGKVQGVGYRYFTEKIAKKLNIFGYVKNLEDGTVEVVAQGKEEDLQKFIEQLKIGPFLAKVEKIDIIFKKPTDIYLYFEIR